MALKPEVEALLYPASPPLNPTGKEYKNKKRDADVVRDVEVKVKDPKTGETKAVTETRKYKKIGNQEIYYEEYGNPKGEPVIMLHGGPGYGSASYYHQYFDPKHYHIILFDQRNANKSTPTAESNPKVLDKNTPKEMMEDISRLADSFGFDKFHLAGGSWGGYLGPLYAAHHPERLHSLTVRALTMGKLNQLNKLYGFDPATGKPGMQIETERMGRWNGTGDHDSCKVDWDRFIKFAQDNEHLVKDVKPKATATTDPTGVYYHLMRSPDANVRQQAAKEWLLLEFTTGDMESTRAEVEEYLDTKMDPKRLMSFALIENNWLQGIKHGREDLHFSKKGDPEFNWFFQGKVQKGLFQFDPMKQIAKVPLIRIVHGQKDNVCPPEDTDKFEAKLRDILINDRHMTEAEADHRVKVIRPPNSGHMLEESGISQGWRELTDGIAKIRKAITDRVNMATSIDLDTRQIS